MLSDLSHKIQKQKSHISSLESLRNQGQHAGPSGFSQKASGPDNEVGESDPSIVQDHFSFHGRQFRSPQFYQEATSMYSLNRSLGKTEWEVDSFWAHWSTTNTQNVVCMAEHNTTNSSGWRGTFSASTSSQNPTFTNPKGRSKYFENWFCVWKWNLNAFDIQFRLKTLISLFNKCNFHSFKKFAQNLQ